MAITIVSQPQIYQPSQNLATWKITSNHANFVYFKVDVYAAVTPQQLIGSFKYYPRPDALNTAIVELSTLIDSVLNSAFLPMNLTQTLRFTTDNVIPINITISEMVNSNGTIISNTNITPPRRFFWMGKLNPFEIQNVNSFYMYNNNSGKILTKNKIRKINQHFESWLSFPMYENIASSSAQDCWYTIYNQEPDLSWSNFYDENIMFVTGQPQKDYRFWNINTSVDHVKYWWGSSPITNYQIRLYRGTTELDRVTYVLDENDCRETINVYFINQYGAWETLQLFSPYFENDYTRTSIGQNQTLLNPDGTYNDFTVSNGRTIYNSNGKVTNTNITSKLSATTDDLRDDELPWIEDIFHSPMIYIKYKGVYLPVSLDTKKHSLQPKRMNTKTNFVTLQFLVQDIF